MGTPKAFEKTAEDWFKEGQALGRLGNHGGAIQAYQKSVELDPNNFKAYFNMGIRFGKIPKNIQAAACFLKALELKPDDVMAHYSRAVVCNLTGEVENAFHHYREAIRINPQFAKAYSNLAMLHYSYKEGMQAMENLVKARRLFADQGDRIMEENAANLVRECAKEFNLSPGDFSDAT